MIKYSILYMSIVIALTLVCYEYPLLIVAVILIGIVVGITLAFRSAGKFTALESEGWHTMGRIVGGLLQLNPVFNEQQKTLLEQFTSSFTNNWDFYEQVDVAFENEAPINDDFDYAKVIEYLTMAKRRDFVLLLFKLAVEDDGIKNDEWIYIHNVMAGLNLTGRLKTYMQRRFSPLRTEYDYEQTESRREETSVLHTTPLVEYFAALGIPANSTKEQVQTSYRDLAMQYHPDLPKNAENHDFCVKKMAEINVAYAKLMERI